MVLPARSSAYWSGWASLCPIRDFSFGTLSPEPEDPDFSWNTPASRPPDSDTLSISCNLDPTLFEDDIPKEQDGRATWTNTQRSKAEGCPAVRTADELSKWVSPQRVSW